MTNTLHWPLYSHLNLVLPQGPRGENGVSLHLLGTKEFISQLPSTGNKENDAYTVLEDGGHVYIWDDTNNIWIDGGQMLGPEGPKGETGNIGPQGNPGLNGKTILSGYGAPNNNIGTVGDFYLRTSNTTLYGPKTSYNYGNHDEEYSSNVWGNGVSLKGLTGNTGATGATGAAGDSISPRGNWNSNTSYVVNDLVYHAASNASYVATQNGSNRTPSSSSSYWTVVAQDGADGAKGDKGDTGLTGPQGPAGASASDTLHTFKASIPSSTTSTGVKGEWAQDNTYLYVCIATNSWKRVAWGSWTNNNNN